MSENMLFGVGLKKRETKQQQMSGSTMLFEDNAKKRTEKAKDKVVGDGAKSVASNKSKDWHKDIECDLCGKWMREDALKNHRGKKFCKAR
jgi:hypothetical protein